MDARPAVAGHIAAAQSVAKQSPITEPTIRSIEKVTDMNTETTYNDCLPVVDAMPEQSVGKRAASAVRRAVRRVVKSMIQAHWERHAVRELASLPDYMLRDIGMRPDDINKVARDLARERADAWARRAQGANGFGS